MANPPVNLAKIAIGNGVLGSKAVFEMVRTVNLPALTHRAQISGFKSDQTFQTSTLETYPQLIGYDHDVYLYFKEQEHLRGYDLNLTYPQNGHFPPPNLIEPTQRNLTELLSKRKALFNRQFFIEEGAARLAKRSNSRGPS